MLKTLLAQVREFKKGIVSHAFFHDPGSSL